MKAGDWSRISGSRTKHDGYFLVLRRCAGKNRHGQSEHLQLRYTRSGRRRLPSPSLRLRWHVVSDPNHRTLAPGRGLCSDQGPASAGRRRCTASKARNIDQDGCFPVAPRVQRVNLANRQTRGDSVSGVEQYDLGWVRAWGGYGTNVQNQVLACSALAPLLPHDRERFFCGFHNGTPFRKTNVLRIRQTCAVRLKDRLDGLEGGRYRTMIAPS